MTTTTRKPKVGVLTLSLAATLLLSACIEREYILPGQRLDPMAVNSPDGPAVVTPARVAATAIALPPMRGNADWTHRAGNAEQMPGHVALGAGTSRIWSADIGQGDDRRHRITADPIVAAGMVFTLDSRARVTATSVAGGRVWSTDVKPTTETGDSASGGGVSYEAGRVFITTGYGELVALDARTGGLLWRQRVNASIGGGPAVQNGVVYVAARNSTGYAVRAEDGRVLWETSGNTSSSSVMGVASPAVSGNTVVFPFPSGQLLAADTQSGLSNWTAQVAGIRVGRAIANVRDVTGDPVIAGGTVYAGTSSGRISAIDTATGIENWSAREGANSPVVPVGGSVFAVNDASSLVRIDAATGGEIWKVDLPYYTDSRVKRQETVHAHYGPILAGGRLVVASSDGLLRMFNPSTGALVGQAQIPGGAAAAPVVAGQTLYVVSRSGQLHAFR
ncbi:PQQ-binding-like beta-propeller repeat protein [Paracoccus tegillarcae]|uniref:Quinoprotein n=1 Tax=Paracoccus tegillarcae TaxID=1529068 RepID=A0A2K9EK13_9RHOB|nr:PQQ-binding-like beta-propeller repeat protein [Paracoccus tegillarcae]AUH33727.1 quinoprotein [Paracoccus tegillarcae]